MICDTELSNNLLSESEQLKKEKRRIRRKSKRRLIRRHSCNQCGERKHYICLNHHDFKKKGITKIYAVIRRYSRKVYFAFLVSIGFAENK